MKICKILTVACVATTGVAFSAPEVTAVSAVSDAGAVTVSYSVNEDSIMTFDVLADGVPVGTNRLAFACGDINKSVSAGTHSFVWDAVRAFPEGLPAKSLSFEVTAWDKSTPPDVIVSDLSDASLRYYVGLDALPGGVTDDRYKTTMLVFRRIYGTAAGVWTMGSAPTENGYNGGIANKRGNFGCELQHQVLFTNDWYIGVYPVTQGQFFFLNGSGGFIPTNLQGSFYTNVEFRMKRPVDNMSYNWLRGGKWPTDGYAGAGGRIASSMRAQAGIANLDLPTEAQWEFSCRAGTTSTFSCGASLGQNARHKGNEAYPTEGMANWESYHNSDTNGISLWNCDNGTPEVGSYRPNAFGLYDMHGGVWEYCLDWCEADKLWDTSVTYVNPVGCTAAESFAKCTVIMRGGAWYEPSENCRSGARRFQAYGGSPSAKWPGCSCTGFRLAVPDRSPLSTFATETAEATVSVPVPDAKSEDAGAADAVDARTRTWKDSLVETVSTLAGGLLLFFK